MITSTMGLRAETRLALAELFRQSRTPVGDLPVFCTVLQDAAARSAVALQALANLQTSFIVERVDEMPASEMVSAYPGLIWSLFMIPQWQEQACVGFDGRLLFRVLDAMYGADDGPVAAVPDRALSVLERTVCSQFATTLMEQVRLVLAKLIVFDLEPARVDQFLDASAFEKTAGDLAVIQLHLVEIGERAFIAVPVRGLELIRDRLDNVAAKGNDPDLDPDWSRSFQRSASASAIELAAYVEGPPMLLSDVAAWAIGSVVEFDASSLQGVRLEIEGGDAIFEGRLGQSQGLFTVCVETPLSKPGKGDASAAQPPLPARSRS